MAGLMLRYYSDTLGMKEKMSNLKQVKGHFEVRHALYHQACTFVIITAESS